MKFRICRIQRFKKEGWAFTLPLDTLVFDTVKEAYERLQKRGIINFGDNSFWVQEISDDGKFSEFPKPLPGLDLPRSGAPLPEYVEQPESQTEQEVTAPVSSTPTAPRQLSDWEKAWGHKKPVLRDGNTT